MKIYSYVVMDDTGFAPNPFWGVCTLACCKAAIRRVIGRKLELVENPEKENYWIVGLSPKAAGNKIIYMMKVTAVRKIADYFYDNDFVSKKPNFGRKEHIYHIGDNIYEPKDYGNYIPLMSLHSKSCHTNGRVKKCNHMSKDLKGVYVLISKCFYYFGSNAETLPNNLKELIALRNHRCNYRNERQLVQLFLNFMRNSKFKKGINAQPTKWPDGDVSWKMGQ